jgi:Ca-activated chloride channel family protein
MDSLVLKSRRLVAGLTSLAIIAATLTTLSSANWSWSALWWTPDQQGDRLMARGEFERAARSYRDPTRIATALYRSGDFEGAGTAYRRLGTPEAQYNQATALVMRGKYLDAVKVYDGALAERPGWREAEENREIARLRAEMLKKMVEEMMGDPNLSADDIVFDLKNQEDGPKPQTPETTEERKAVSDAELQAMWLRRLQTRPADFLRAKFAYQVQAKSATDKSR